MAKPGRNDSCPCGSGKKYKKCCQPKEQAEQRKIIANDQAAREERAAARRLEQRAAKAAFLSRLAGADEEDELTTASNAAAELVRAGNLEEAEAAARDLLARFPEVHDGWDRLGMVHEARGETKLAADCYRKAIEIIRAQPDNYDPECRRVHQTRRQARSAGGGLITGGICSRTVRALHLRPSSILIRSTTPCPQLASRGSKTGEETLYICPRCAMWLTIPSRSGKRKLVPFLIHGLTI